MSFYYFMASLPSLVLGVRPPLQVEAFRTQAREHLTPAQDAELDALFAGMEGTSGFARGYALLEDQIVQTTACMRRRRQGTSRSGECTPAGRQVSGHVDAMIHHAMEQTNPRETELALDRLRWRTIEELAGADRFSLDAVLAYGLQLRIAWRWASLDAEAGRARLEHEIESALGDGA